MRRGTYIFVALTVLLLAACTKAELCYEAEHPHRAGVRFNFDWSAATGDQYAHVVPDSMFVLAKRVIGTWKCELKVNSQDGKGWYVWNAPERKLITPDEPEEEPEDDNPDGGDVTIDDGADGGNGGNDGGGATAAPTRADGDDGDGSDGNGSDSGDDGSGDDTQPASPYEPLAGVDFATDEFQIRTGVFKCITFNRDTTELIYDEVDRYIRGEQTDTTMLDLNLEYKRYAYSDPALRGTVEYWKDYNQYGDGRNYIQHDITPIYYDTIAPCQVDKDVLQQFTMKPHLLTQNIDVRFHIRKQTDVNEGGMPFIIDSVYTEIAGVPYKVNLSNDYIDISQTCKMMFKNTLEDTNGREIQDTETNDYVRCHGNIDVLSIVNAPDMDAGRGPGILQVMIFIRDYAPIRGKVNLYNAIYRANLYEITEDGEHARRRKEHGIIEINSDLVIDAKHIIPTDEEGGLDRWQASEDDLVIDV